MNEQEMSKNNMILKIKSGSHLYGTTTENSDEDFIGIFVPDEDYILGFKKCDEVSNNLKSKHDNGKNTKEAVDFKSYDIRKFLKLAMENNPNIIELLFAKPEHLEFFDEYGLMILDNKSIFPYKGLYDKFVGYALSQRHKMVMRTDKFFELNNAKEFLENEDPKTVLAEFKVKKLPFLQFKKGFFTVGDINLLPGIFVKKALNHINARLDQVGNRKELITHHGYDTKFASHLIRLLREGIELLETGEISFPLDYADIILEIKKGNLKITDVINMADGLEDRIRGARENSILPDKPNFDKINDLSKCIIKKFLFEGGRK